MIKAFFPHREEKVALLSIFVVWLMHITAMIGIGNGNLNFFVEKTPFTLLIITGVLVFNYKLDSIKKLVLFVLFGLVGMLAEWLGVSYGLFFGEYVYGTNFGPKLDGVPYLIGVNWAILVFITGSISNHLSNNIAIKILSGALLMVILDYFMETSAPIFDYWTFEGGIAPLQNYVAWFIIAALLHTIYQLCKLRGNFVISLHLYLAQLIFFIFFYGLF
ncbi:hypothetical protein GCM10009117_11590 [Gangjinia marincola]|uniref:Carotenoid biosynthesis protein n=1 Tax=Gangjinia marincola TaxID=578463 RepID=A0ABP3XWJ3_9FLAO